MSGIMSPELQEKAQEAAAQMIDQRSLYTLCYANFGEITVRLQRLEDLMRQNAAPPEQIPLPPSQGVAGLLEHINRMLIEINGKLDRIPESGKEG